MQFLVAFVGVGIIACAMLDLRPVAVAAREVHDDSPKAPVVMPGSLSFQAVCLGDGSEASHCVIRGPSSSQPSITFVHHRFQHDRVSKET